jgi:hypothetical protein
MPTSVNLLSEVISTILISVLATSATNSGQSSLPDRGNPPLTGALVTMSVASSDQRGTAEPCHAAPSVCQFKCILCRKRFWKKKVLVNRSAKCRGTRSNPDGSRWYCRAWRCRFNDQCPSANLACPICGAYKPPEFRPSLPAPEALPTTASGSAFLVDPSPTSTVLEAPADIVDNLLRPTQVLPEDRELEEREWQRYVENRPRSSFLADNTTQGATEVQLPLYGNVVARTLTEV